MQDWLRTLFSVRIRRKTPAAGPMPPQGASVANGMFKMRITDAMPRELWEWMVLWGWRDLPVSQDRRTYVELPGPAFQDLARATAADREALHARMLRVAKKSIQ